MDRHQVEVTNTLQVAIMDPHQGEVTNTLQVAIIVTMVALAALLAVFAISFYCY